MKTPSSASSLLAIVAAATAAIQPSQAQPQLKNCTKITGPGLQSQSLYFDQMGDSDEHVLVQIQSLSDVSFTSETECGVDSYHTQAAQVLEVKRTVKESSNFVGDSVGTPLKNCDLISFQTSVKEWTQCCAEPKDPGTKQTGWCGYVYLNPSSAGELMEKNTYKYITGAGGQSFEAVDESICAAKLKELCGGNSGVGVVSLTASMVAVAVASMTLFVLV